MGEARTWFWIRASSAPDITTGAMLADGVAAQGAFAGNVDARCARFLNESTASVTKGRSPWKHEFACSDEV
jgi:hypothetical protein